MKKYEKPQAKMMVFKSKSVINSTNTAVEGRLASDLPESIGRGEYSKLKVFTK